VNDGAAPRSLVTEAPRAVTPPHRREWARSRFLLALLAVTALAFAIRVGCAIEFQGLSAPPDAGSNPDQLDYELFGWRVANGEGYTLATGEPTARRPPGTSFALLPPYLLFGHDRAAARVWFCLLSAATCFVSGLIGATLFGPFIGLLAATVLALLPGHFYYAMHFLSEVPYGLWIALACYGAVKSIARPAERSTLPVDVATGLAYGLAILTRPQVAFAGPLAAAAVLLAPKGLRAKRFKQVVTVGIATALVLAPWIARNHHVFGKPLLSTIGGVTFWGANNPVIASDPERAGGWMPVDTLVDADHPLAGGEVEKDAAAWRYGIDFLRSHERDVPRLLGQKLLRHFSPFHPTDNRAVYWSFALSWLALLPFLVTGCVIGWRRQPAATLVLLLPVFSTIVTALVFYGLIRFRDADASLYVVPAAAALAALVPRQLTARAEPK
jgi:4-amino-4-deoxy-L-arabinose transferase-like glycosyltransferase